MNKFFLIFFKLKQKRKNFTINTHPVYGFKKGYLLKLKIFRNQFFPVLTLIPCLMSKYDKLYIIGKLLCSTFKKLSICKNCIFLQNIIT